MQFITAVTKQFNADGFSDIVRERLAGAGLEVTRKLSASKAASSDIEYEHAVHTISGIRDEGAEANSRLYPCLEGISMAVAVEFAKVIIDFAAEHSCNEVDLGSVRVNTLTTGTFLALEFNARAS